MKVRLNKFLANAGVTSRRGADALIGKGEVKVNGTIITELGIKIDPEVDKVVVNGKTLESASTHVYYALYKPKGVVSTADDEKGREKVTDLVPSIPRVYPVGRLDADSEGLIILTNDGDLTQKLTHPSFEHEKEYSVEVKSPKSKGKISPELSKSICDQLITGLHIDDHIMKADTAKVIDIQKSTRLAEAEPRRIITLQIVLHTGYNRQIRKMCDRLGLVVINLKRVRIGKLNLEDLDISAGQYKIISKDQIL